MGAALSMRLASSLRASGLDPSLVEQLLEPTPGSERLINAGVRAAMTDAIHLIFVIAFVAAVLGLVSVLFTPRKELTEAESVSRESYPPPVSAD